MTQCAVSHQQNLAVAALERLILDQGKKTAVVRLAESEKGRGCAPTHTVDAQTPVFPRIKRVERQHVVVHSDQPLYDARSLKSMSTNHFPQPAGASGWKQSLFSMKGRLNISRSWPGGRGALPALSRRQILYFAPDPHHRSRNLAVESPVGKRPLPIQARRRPPRIGLPKTQKVSWYRLRHPTCANGNN
jgi:hypothetical protein